MHSKSSKYTHAKTSTSSIKKTEGKTKTDLKRNQNFIAEKGAVRQTGRQTTERRRKRRRRRRKRKRKKNKGKKQQNLPN